MHSSGLSRPSISKSHTSLWKVNINQRESSLAIKTFKTVHNVRIKKLAGVLSDRGSGEDNGGDTESVESHFFEWEPDGGSFQGQFFLIYKETGIDCSTVDWKNTNDTRREPPDKQRRLSKDHSPTIRVYYLQFTIDLELITALCERERAERLCMLQPDDPCCD